jgi:hypothetical protein
MQLWLLQMVHSNYFSRPKWANPRSFVSPQKFRAKFFRFGQNFPKSANSSAEQWTKFAQIGRNSPEILEGKPQLRGFARFARKNIYCVSMTVAISTRLVAVFFRCISFKMTEKSNMANNLISAIAHSICNLLKYLNAFRKRHVFLSIVQNLFLSILNWFSQVRAFRHRFASILFPYDKKPQDGGNYQNGGSNFTSY